MNWGWKQIVIGAVGGFLAAVRVDLDAFKASPPGEDFSWKLAFARWCQGAVLGAMAGLSVGQIPG